MSFPVRQHYRNWRKKSFKALFPKFSSHFPFKPYHPFSLIWTKILANVTFWRFTTFNFSSIFPTEMKTFFFSNPWKNCRFEKIGIISTKFQERDDLENLELLGSKLRTSARSLFFRVIVEKNEKLNIQDRSFAFSRLPLHFFFLPLFAI